MVVMSSTSHQTKKKQRIIEQISFDTILENGALMKKENYFNLKMNDKLFNAFMEARNKIVFRLFFSSPKITNLYNKPSYLKYLTISNTRKQ